MYIDNYYMLLLGCRTAPQTPGEEDWDKTCQRRSTHHCVSGHQRDWHDIAKQRSRHLRSKQLCGVSWETDSVTAQCSDTASCTDSGCVSSRENPTQDEPRKSVPQWKKKVWMHCLCVALACVLLLVLYVYLLHACTWLYRYMYMYMYMSRQPLVYMLTTLCMCTCMCVCVYVCMCVCVCVCVCVCRCVCVYMTCVCVYVYTCVRVCVLCVCVCVCVWVCVWVWLWFSLCTFSREHSYGSKMLAASAAQKSTSTPGLSETIHQSSHTCTWHYLTRGHSSHVMVYSSVYIHVVSVL